MDASRFEVQRLDHLGLVAGFCKEIGLEELINQRMPKVFCDTIYMSGYGEGYREGKKRGYEDGYAIAKYEERTRPRYK